MANSHNQRVRALDARRLGAYLGGDVSLRAGVGVEPRDGQVGVCKRGAAAPQLLLRARVQPEAVLQHRQFLQEHETNREGAEGHSTNRSEERGAESRQHRRTLNSHHHHYCCYYKTLKPAHILSELQFIFVIYYIISV